MGGSESFRQPVIPPAPLTGDVGRGCGDASRALLFFRGRQRRWVSSRLKLDQESGDGWTVSVSDYIFFGSPLSPWHFSVTVSFALAPASIARHETARSFSERHRAPLLPQVPPIADGAGAYHASCTRAGIAGIRVFQMRARPRGRGPDRSVEVRRGALAFRGAETAGVSCRRNTWPECKSPARLQRAGLIQTQCNNVRS
jgi:hypothetical protein